jgi:Pathogenicity locus.
VNPSKVRRDRLLALTDLPNIGPAMARDLRLLGFERPEQLAGQNPQALYDRLCILTKAASGPLRAGCLRVRDQVHGRG